MIRVLIADESTFARKAVREALQAEPDIELVGWARDHLDTLDAVPTARPHVVIVECDAPTMNAPATVLALRRQPSPPGIVVVVSIGRELEADVAALGAAGVVRRPVVTVGPEYEKAVAELIVAIRAAHPTV